MIDLKKLTKGKSDKEIVKIYIKELKISEKQAWEIVNHEDVVVKK
jgi:hypothetical protein